jgi:hypothetical protein
MAIYVKAYITEAGEIKADLPKNHPVGEVTLFIAEENQEAIPWDTQPWTQEELDEMLASRPSTLGEILSDGLVGGWDDRGITDSVEWIKEQRRKRRERRGNWTLS